MYHFSISASLSLFCRGLFRWHESLPHGLDHLREPEKVQHAQCRVPDQVHAHQPHGQVANCTASRFVKSHAAVRVSTAFLSVKHRPHELGLRDRQRFVDVRVDHDGLVCTPYDAAAKKGYKESDTVVEL